MDIQLTAAQRLQQELINGFITNLEQQIQQGGTGTNINADLGDTLNSLFVTFDKNQDAKFNANELTELSAHLREVNNNQNIAQLFTTDGQLNSVTTNRVDITGNGQFNGQDLVALQQILDSRTPTTQTSEDGNVMNIQNGLVVSGTYNGINYSRSNIIDNFNYTQTNEDGTVMSVQNGLVVSGTYSNGISFSRENVSQDNLSYTETASNGNISNLENGLVVSGTYNGINYTRSNIVDNFNYTQTNEDGTVMSVQNGLVVSGTYGSGAAAGVGFTRENVSQDNLSYIEHQSNGFSYNVVNGQYTNMRDEISSSSDLLYNDYGVRTDSRDFLSNTNPTNVVATKQIVDKMLANNQNNPDRRSRIDTTSLYADLVSVLTDPFQKINDNYSRDDSNNVLLDILKLQEQLQEQLQLVTSSRLEG